MDERIGAFPTPDAIGADDWATHVAFVRRLARSLVADSATAEDLAQDAWVRFLDGPARESLAPRGWFAAVLRNLVRFRARSIERRERRERDTARVEPQPAAADVVAQIDLHRRVVEQVLALPEPWRAVIALRFHEQRSLAEVARELGLPLEAVKTRQKRALQQLRKELLGAEDGGGTDRVGERRAERWQGLLLLAQGGGGIAMSVGTKWGIGAAAGVVALLLAARVWSGDRTDAPLASDRAASSPDAAAAAAPPAPAEPAEFAAARAREATPPTATPAEPPAAPPYLTARLRGEVVDQLGNPRSGVAVEVFERDGRSGDRSKIAATTTDGRGTFELTEVPFGRRTSAVVAARDGAACSGEEIVPRSDQHLRLVLGPTRAIVGKVVDERGIAIADATLVAAMRNRDPDVFFIVPESVQREISVRSGPDGAFKLPAVPCSTRVTVAVECAGFASRRESFALDDSPADYVTTIVLLPAVAVEGRVTHADGSPAPGIRVGAQLADRTVRFRNSWGEAQTDADGRYRIGGLEAGPWNVFVQLDERQEKEWCALAAESVELSAAAPVARADFVLIRGGELIIHVRDARTGEPIPDHWIGIQSAAKSRSGAAINAVFSDDDGTASLRLPPGPVHAYVSEQSQAWTQQDGTLVEGGTLEFTVEVDAGATLRGVVFGPDGGPVADALVWADGATLIGESARTTTREDGSFELAGVRSFAVVGDPRGDSFHLHAAAPGLALREPAQIAAADGAGGPIELRLVTRPPTFLRGRVVDAAGRAVVGADVRGVEGEPFNPRGDANSPDPSLRTKSDTDGRFELRGIWAGRPLSVYAVRILEDGGAVTLEHVDQEVAPLTGDEARDVGELILREQERGH